MFLAILLLALATRCVGLDRSFVLDEFRTIKFSSALGPAKILDATRVDSYPPFSYLALSAWMAISRDDAWIRLLFVLFGMASVVAAFFLGREAVNPRYALIAMFLLALMPIQVWSSQYVRGIAPAILFLLLSALFFMRLIRDEKIRLNMNLIGYIASASLAAYSFYYSFLVIFAQNAVYLFQKRRRLREIAKWFAVQAVIAALYLPWIGGFLRQLKDANIVMNFAATADAGLKLGAFKIGMFLRAFSGLLGLDQAFLVNTAVSRCLINKFPACKLSSCLAISGALVFLLSGYVVYLFVRFVKRIDNKKLLYVFSALALTPLAISLVLNIAAKIPIMPRYLAVSSAFLVFVYALILHNIKGKKMLFLALVIFTSFSLWRLSDFTRAVIDYKGAAIFVKGSVRDEDCLLFIGGDRAYEYYSGAFPKNYVSSENYMRKYGIGSGHSLEFLVDKDALAGHLGPFRRLLIYTSGEQMSGVVRHVLGLVEKFGYGKDEEVNFKNMAVYRYARQ